MSWIIQSLLNDRERIKEECNVDDDDFNDLLLIEKAVDTLREKTLLSLEDLEVLKMRESSSPPLVTKGEKFTRQRKFSALCDRIAYYLGGYFTDDGYLDYMQIKYGLTSEQVNTLREFIKSEYKHKIMRKEFSREKSHETI